MPSKGESTSRGHFERRTQDAIPRDHLEMLLPRCSYFQRVHFVERPLPNVSIYWKVCCTGGVSNEQTYLRVTLPLGRVHDCRIIGKLGLRWKDFTVRNKQGVLSDNKLKSEIPYRLRRITINLWQGKYKEKKKYVTLSVGSKAGGDLPLDLYVLMVLTKE